MSDNGLSDHDMLIRLDEKVDHLTTKICNHLKHHMAIEGIIIAAILGGAITWLLK